MNIWVNIGGKLLPSLKSSTTAAARQIEVLNRKLRLGAAETKAELKGISAAAAPLFGLAAAGGLTLGLTKVIGNSSQLAHEMQMLRNIGLNANQVAGAFVQANKTISELPTTTILDNIRALREGVGAFGDYQHAIENLTFNQKIGSMMKNMLGADFDAGHAIASGIRALEIRGSAMDHHRYQSEMGELYKSMIFFGERFSPDQLAAFSATGNIPIKGYNTRFLTRILPAMIQEFGGGDTTGTMASAFRNQIMGRVPLGGKRLTQEWIRLGLIPPNGTAGNLSRTGWSAGSVKGHALAMADPFAWVEKILLPAMQAHGVDTGNTNAVLTQVSKMFGRETAVRFVATMADPNQRRRLHRDEANINRVQGVDQAYGEAMRRDPLVAWSAVKSSFTNLSSVIFGTGKGDSPVAVALVHVANGVNMLVGVIERHPWLGQGIGALLGFSAGVAGLKLFGVGVMWLLSPLKAVGALARWAFGRNVLAGIARFGPTLLRELGGALGRGLMRLGPLALRGLVAIGPWLLRGLAAAFGLLSNPVGWAILAASAALLIWRYRESIARGWHAITTWFTTTAWPAVKNTITSINWSSIGMAIADALTFGLASKIKSANWGGIIRGAATGFAVGGLGGGLAGAVTGARAKGGPMRAGGTYLVGEEGPELVTPDRNGFVMPADATRRAMAGVAATGQDGGARPAVANDRARGPVTFNIYGATDAQAVARAVDERLRWYERQASALYSD